MKIRRYTMIEIDTTTKPVARPTTNAKFDPPPLVESLQSPDWLGVVAAGGKADMVERAVAVPTTS
jgi:hypothetical protein